MAVVGSFEVNLYGKALQIIRLPESHFEGLASIGRGDGNVLDLTGMAVYCFSPDWDSLNLITRPDGGEWGGAKKWMRVVHTGPGGNSVGIEGS